MSTARTSAQAAVRGAWISTLVGTQAGLANVRQAWRVILQASLAASLAYAVAQAIGHETPFFAPIAAVATVAVSLANRLRRASELVVGNAIGILFADLLIAQTGTGAWQVGLVVALALTAALTAGGGPILIVQASSAAVLVATLMPPTEQAPWATDRFVDALVGGGVGLIIAALVLPVEPARATRTAADPILTALADGYARIGDALSRRDQAAAEWVLADLRATAPVLQSFHAGLDATREAVRLAPWYWSYRTRLAAYATAGAHLDNALRNLRVLARQAVVALDRDEPVAASLPGALDQLAAGTRQVGQVLAGNSAAPDVQALLLEAVASTGDHAHQRQPADPAPGLFSTPMIAQVRLSVADLLQASGATSQAAIAAIRAAGDGQTQDLRPPHKD